MRDLGTLGGDWSRAVAINGRGQIIGWSHVRSNLNHAFSWQNAKITDLHRAGPPSRTITRSTAARTADPRIHGTQSRPHPRLPVAGQEPHRPGALGGSRRTAEQSPSTGGARSSARVRPKRRRTARRPVDAAARHLDPRVLPRSPWQPGYRGEARSWPGPPCDVLRGGTSRTSRSYGVFRWPQWSSWRPAQKAELDFACVRLRGGRGDGFSSSRSRRSHSRSGVRR